MKTLLLSLVLATNVLALTEDQILEINKAPHSRHNLIKELDIFSEAREFKVSYTINFPAGAMNPPNIVVKEKTAQGKYIVSEFTVGPPNNFMDLVMVATYNAEIKSYKKWLLNKANKEIQEFTGVRLPNSTFISWVRIDDGRPKGMSLILSEEHGEGFVKWIENYYQDGKLTFSLSGHAVKQN